MSGKIYVIRCEFTNKSYVGQTIKSLTARLQEHLRYAKNGGDVHLSRAIQKHGHTAFSIQLLEECNESILNEREVFWIKKLNSKDEGYNETYGGEGVKGYKHDLEKRKRMRMNHWTRSKNAKEIQSRSTKTRQQSYPHLRIETIQKIAAKNMGQKRSLETRKLQSLKATGVLNSMYGTLAPNRRRVEQLSIDGQHIAFHVSITSAIQSLNVKSAAIAGCCAGRFKTSHGFCWRYVDNFIR